MTDRLIELGLEPECSVRDLLLVGGPAAGGYVSMPEKGKGEFVIHNLPLHIEEFQNAEGEWDFHVVSGGGTTDPTTGESLGSMVYRVIEGTDTAEFVRSDHNPTDESQDTDLNQVAPYLAHAPVVGDPLTPEQIAQREAAWRAGQPTVEERKLRLVEGRDAEV